MRSSIRTRLTIAFIGLAVGPLLLVGLILARRSFTTQEQQAFTLQHEVAQRVTTQVAAFFEKVEDQLHLIGWGQGLQSLGRDKQNSILSELLLYQDVFEELFLLDSQGQVQIHLARLSLTPTDPGEWTEAEEFVVPQASGQVYYSPVRFDEATGEPSMTIAVPLFDARTGLVDRTLIAEVRIKKIWDLIAGIRVSRGQSVYIIDAQDRIVAHRNPSVVLRGTTFEVPDQDGIHSGLSKTRAVMAMDKVRLGQQELNIVSEQSLSEALAMSTTMIYVIVTVIFVAVVIAGGLGFLIVRQIIGPIQSMALTAQTISAGDLLQQVEITSRDEIGALATAFNSMTAQLVNMLTKEEERTHELNREIVRRKKIEDALRESEERLNLALSAANQGIWDWNMDGDTVHFDDRYYTMTGYEPNEFPETFKEWEKRLHPDDIERTKAAVAQYLAGENDTFDIEFRFLRKEGNYMWIRGQGKIVTRDKEGNSIRFIGTHTDMTERKHAEEALQRYRGRLEELVDERTHELEVVQAELLKQERLAVLGQLTATVSHEIRNPLATIRTSAFAIRRRTHDKGLGVERALERLERNVTRCDNIIAELLDYTRMPDVKLESVFFDAWLEQLLTELTLPDGIAFSLEPASGSEILLDQERFRRVIINLVDNACQAMQETSEADKQEQKLTVRTDVIEERVRVSITDTGPGIPPDVLPHIFEPLYSTKGFGVGLGLPVVREVMKQHRGNIEIISDVGKGTRVILWLPLS